MPHVVAASRGKARSRGYRPTIWTITSGTSVVNGFVAPYDAIAPGDIIELAPTGGTPRGVITFKNLFGTPGKRITIRNGNGEVVINTATNYGMYLQNLNYVHVDGKSYGQAYGIHIAQAYVFGIRAANACRNIEINNVKIDSVIGSYSIGIHFQTYPSTHPDGWGDYDYDGDGFNDTLTRATYTEENVYIHNCYFDGGDVTDMAMYIGHSNPNDPPDSEGTHTDYPYLSNTDLSFNYCTGIANKVIQMGSCMSGGRVHDNTIIDCIIAGYTSDIQAININPSANVDVYNNWIQDCSGNGITFQCNGGKIHDNLIIRCGRTSTFYNYGVAIFEKSSYYPTTNSTFVLNNTIVTPHDYGVGINSNVGGSKFLYNNIIVGYTTGSWSYTQDGSYSYSNNYNNASVSGAVFVNAAGDNYQLDTGSPGIDTGIDVYAYGILRDGTGITLRKIGTAVDRGCYERAA